MRLLRWRSRLVEERGHECHRHPVAVAEMALHLYLVSNRRGRVKWNEEERFPANWGTDCQRRKVLGARRKTMRPEVPSLGSRGSGKAMSVVSGEPRRDR